MRIWGVNTWCHSISVTFKFWCWVPRESVLRGSRAQNLKVTLIEWLLKLTLLEWHQVFRPIDSIMEYLGSTRNPGFRYLWSSFFCHILIIQGIFLPDKFWVVPENPIWGNSTTTNIHSMHALVVHIAFSHSYKQKKNPPPKNRTKMHTINMNELLS